MDIQTLKVFVSEQELQELAVKLQPPDAPVKLPATKAPAPFFLIALDGCLAGFPPAQHRPDAQLEVLSDRKAW